MAYGDFRDLKRRTASDKVLRDKIFNIAKNSKKGLASLVSKFFYKKCKVSGVNIEVKHNEQLAEELQKPIIELLKKQ